MHFLDLKAEGMSLGHTFLNGQCFRWNLTKENSFIGVVAGKVYEAKKMDANTLRLYNATEDERDFFQKYFDLDRNYIGIEKALSGMDSVLAQAVEFGRGMRILRQEPWEVVVSFILSVQKNIASTQKNIERLCEKYGQKIFYQDCCFYAFPEAKELADSDEESIRQTKCGFRAKGVLDAARKVNEGEVVLSNIFDLTYERAREELQKIYGVGQKVADCILLFGFGKYAACPIDTWMKKALETLYGVRFYNMGDYHRFAQKKWESYSGYAQQYIFYYMRENYRKIKK